MPAASHRLTLLGDERCSRTSAWDAYYASRRYRLDSCRTGDMAAASLDDLTRLGEVIDTATAAGANQVQRVRFTLKRPEQIQARALREAAANARAQADALASALGVRILRVLSAEESTPPMSPVDDVQALSAEAAGYATPIEAGTIDAQSS
jgi:uncharacterized protein YggE